MPTQIMLKTDDGNEVGMSTEDFAEYRQKIGKEPFEYKGETIVGYAENPYVNFGVEGDKSLSLTLISRTRTFMEMILWSVLMGVLFLQLSRLEVIHHLF